MPRLIEHDRKKEMVSFIEKHCKEHTMSEIARMLKITPSAVRFHGLEAGIVFERKKWSTKKLVFQEGKFFNESHRENWLV